MNENQPQTLPVYPVQYIPNTQDEISLVDIWLILRKHRKLFFITAAGVTLLGLGLALLTPKVYELKTSLEIGTEIRKGIPTPIEAPETVKAKLESSLIPMVKNNLNRKKEETETYQVGVIIPKASSLVVLYSNASKTDEDKYKELHSKIVDAIRQDHIRFTKILQQNLRFELAKANIKLDEIQDPTTLDILIKRQLNILTNAKADLSALNDPEILGAKLKALEGDVQNEKNKLVSLEGGETVLNQQLKQISNNQELIASQIKELEAELSSIMTSKKSSAQGVENETSAMALLMFDNEAQQNRKWLAALKERSIITLESERAHVQFSLDDNNRAQRLQLDKIAEAEANLKAFVNKNMLEQNKLKASIAESDAGIAHLVNTQQRRITTQQQAVAEIQARLDNLLETRALVDPALSADPISTPKRVILMIAMLLGGILGIAAVFFAELREKVAETVSEQ